MTKQEVLDSLERIKDSMDMDFLNRQEIEGIVKDIRAMNRQSQSKSHMYVFLSWHQSCRLHI